MNFLGMSLAEFAVIENIRDLCGNPSTLLITGWSQDKGAVITELPTTSRAEIAEIESDTAALEAALASRRQPPTPGKEHDHA